MVNRKNSGTRSYWSDIWGSPTQNPGNGNATAKCIFCQHISYLKHLNYSSICCPSTLNLLKLIVLSLNVLPEEEASERAKRAAAAARRWREYSRRGADKPPTYKLPEAVGNKD
jgi:hypothetical protein